MFADFKWKGAFCCALLALAGATGAFADPTAPAAAKVPPNSDVLVYRDGDRVRGTFVAREGNVIVFQSLRFGELRVLASDAELMTSTAAAKAATPTTAKKPAKSDGEDTPATIAANQPVGLTAALRNFFGPWHGRFAFSSQVISDTTDRNDVVVEMRLTRKWERDQLKLETRYEYSETDNLVTADVMKANGNWQHTLTKRYFSIYHPSLEWNRAFEINNIATDYVLLQQEIGLGMKLWDTDRRKLQVGFAENFFDVWSDGAGDSGHTTEHVESVFAEAEFKLPWRILMTDRVVYYYSLATGRDGWENQFEITKKLTETLTLGLRQEVRYNTPDVRTQNYSLVRLLLGFDF